MRKLSQFAAFNFIARTCAEPIAPITISGFLCKIHPQNRQVFLLLKEETSPGVNLAPLHKGLVNPAQTNICHVTFSSGSI